MEELIQVFRMDELPNEVRAKVIIRLGDAINHMHGMSLTEPLVYELLKILDPQNEKLKDERFVKLANR